MTYVVSFMYKGGAHDDPANYYLIPAGDYGPFNANCWECDPNTDPTCLGQILIDFQTIKAMGFNTVHVAGLEPSTRDYLSEVPDDIGNQDYRFSLPSKRRDGHWDQEFSYEFTRNEPATLVPTDPFIQLLMQAIDDVAALAHQAGLQLIIDTQGQHNFRSDVALDDIDAYLAILADHIHQNQTPLMAYIVVGEPASNNLHESGETNKKKEVCDATNRWYNMLKAHDPDHLIGCGFLGLESLTTWDPGVEAMDFFFPHPYPAPRGSYAYEDVGDQHNQAQKLDRVLAQLYWIGQNCPKPWMVGEIGFNEYHLNHYEPPSQCTAIVADAGYEDNIHCENWGWDPVRYDGYEIDQRDFFDITLAATRNFGGAGYAVWTFQDAYSNECDQNTGVLRNGSPTAENFMDPLSNVAKLGTAVFVNYLTDGQPPPVITPAGPPDAYYDMIHSAEYSAQYFGQGTIEPLTGTVQDQFARPIKDALVVAKTWTGNEPVYNDDGSIEYYAPVDNIHYTFTDENGHYSIVPFDHIHPTDLDRQYIRWIFVTALGGSQRDVNGWGWSGMGENGVGAWPPTVSTPCDFTPNSGRAITIALPRLSEVVGPEVIWDENYHSYSALKELTIAGTWSSSVDILTGIVDFKAGKEVNVMDEFWASNQSETHIWVEPIFLDCEEFPDDLRSLSSPSTSTVKAHPKSAKSIQLQFGVTRPAIQLGVAPNPVVDAVTFSVEGEVEGAVRLEIFDMSGQLVRRYDAPVFPMSMPSGTLAKAGFIARVSGSFGQVEKPFIIQ